MPEKIRVKVLGCGSRDSCLRQFPASVPVWGRCQFIFDPEETNYDWLVVYHGFPKRIKTLEKLRCPKGNTLLVTTEPASVRAYGLDYTRQFNYVLTSQPEWALPHKNRIFSQTALRWFYGSGFKERISHEAFYLERPLKKNKLISTVCSNKKQRHTLHNKRYKFTQALKKQIPQLDIYGHGVRYMVDKSEALDNYRYHIAIENYAGKHCWTEKLADAFLGLTLPFYYGCLNVCDYFPKESFIPIDIFDWKKSIEIIKKAIAGNQYEKRLSFIEQAKKLVLKRYNLFAVLSSEIEARHCQKRSASCGSYIIYSAQKLRKSPYVALRHLKEKIRLRLLHSGNYFT